jgi:hypothetical protein
MDGTIPIQNRRTEGTASDGYSAATLNFVQFPDDLGRQSDPEPGMAVNYLELSSPSGDTITA